MFAHEMLDLFSQKSPVCVMVRATLENVLADERLDEIFAQHAQRQYCRELSFSSCAQLMALVVARIRPSIHAAYAASAEDFAVSVRSVYNKLKGIERAVTEALVRETATDLATAIGRRKGVRNLFC